MSCIYGILPVRNTCSVLMFFFLNKMAPSSWIILEKQRQSQYHMYNTSLILKGHKYRIHLIPFSYTEFILAVMIAMHLALDRVSQILVPYQPVVTTTETIDCLLSTFEQPQFLILNKQLWLMFVHNKAISSKKPWFTRGLPWWIYNS